MASKHSAGPLALVCLIIAVATADKPGAMEKRILAKIHSDFVFVQYWISYAKVVDSKSYTDCPLVIWLPDMLSNNLSDTIYYKEFFINQRTVEWASDVNILFIEAPSYENRYENDTTIAVVEDLSNFLRDVFNNLLKELLHVPLYIYGEGFSGKPAVALAHEILKWTFNEKPFANLKGVILNAPWLSPIDHIKTWNDVLSHAHLITGTQYEDLQNRTTILEFFYKSKNFYGVFFELSRYLKEISKLDSEISFDNIDDPEKNNRLTVKQVLNIIFDIVSLPKQPGEQDDPDFSRTENLFYSLWSDFMTPFIVEVQGLLNHGSLEVNVISGDRGLLCPYNSTVEWIKKISPEHFASTRHMISLNGSSRGYYQITGKLRTYYIFEAGQSIIKDQPEIMYEVIKNIT